MDQVHGAGGKYERMRTKKYRSESKSSATLFSVAINSVWETSVR